jgi:transcriptional regulator with XRE-family HTH domain
MAADSSELSDRPASEALAALMEELALSNRRLAAATRKVDGRGMGHASIGNIRRGDDAPSIAALELLADAMGVDPDYFAEVRLARARDQLDPRVVGLKQALAALDRLDGALRTSATETPRRAALAGGPVPPPPGVLLPAQSRSPREQAPRQPRRQRRASSRKP